MDPATAVCDTGTVPGASQLYRRIAAHSKRPLHQPGRDLVMLEGGEPSFATPPHVVEAMAAALRDGHTHYPHGGGDPELRAALAERLTTLAGRPFGSDEVYITHGAGGACAAAVLASVDPGDRVVLPDPTYSLHTDQVIAADAVPVFTPLGPDLHLDLDALDRAATGARMLLLTNPSNPTGIAYTRAELEAVGEIARRHDLVVLSDEVYGTCVFDGHAWTSTLQIPALRDRLLYAQTFGKTYAMTGWRIGYLAGPAELVARCRTVHRTLGGSVNTAVQRAALAALDTDDAVLEAMRREYQDRRDLAHRMLSGIDGVRVRLPEAGYYVMVEVAGGPGSLELARIAEEHGVTVRAGVEYGPAGEGRLRVAFCVDRDELVEGLTRLRRALTSL